MVKTGSSTYFQEHIILTGCVVSGSVHLRAHEGDGVLGRGEAGHLLPRRLVAVHLVRSEPGHGGGHPGAGEHLAHLNTATSHSRSVSRSVLGMGEQLSRSAARPAQLCAARPSSSWRGERSGSLRHTAHARPHLDTVEGGVRGDGQYQLPPALAALLNVLLVELPHLHTSLLSCCRLTPA